jgi:hypothetical protein
VRLDGVPHPVWRNMRGRLTMARDIASAYDVLAKMAVS